MHTQFITPSRELLWAPYFCPVAAEKEVKPWPVVSDLQATSHSSLTTSDWWVYDHYDDLLAEVSAQVSIDLGDR